MSAISPALQGRAFETNLCDLLVRILSNDLECRVLKRRIQPSGSQHGKDLQLKWWDPALSSNVFWQFECKSHTKGPLPAKEVATKLLDIMRSSHEVDVWCLALAHVEPGAWIDETLPWIESSLDAPFALEVLSKGQNDIEALFACEPDLYERQYSREPDSALVKRRPETIDRFRRFLDDATKRSRTARSKPWQIVSASPPPTPDDPQAAAAYLKGLGATTPWAAISNGWAVWRATSVQPLLTRVLDPVPGFEFAWLVAAGGEGKTTVLRQVAWEVATKHEDWVVLWTEAQLREGGAEAPVKLIEQMAEGRSLLVCVDGSEGLQGIHSLRRLAEERAADGIRVFVLIADRGAAWHRNSLAGKLSRGLPHKDRRLDLVPLSEDEARELVAILDSRSLLNTSAEEALQLLRHGSEEQGNWLLPTLMRITDPERRGLEGILASVVDGLSAHADPKPLLLLLAASLVQASGHLLPQELGERLAGGPSELTSALATLTAELEKQLRVSRSAIGVGNPPGVLLTHHRVLAEAFVTIAADSADHLETFVNACEELPQSIKEDIDEERLIPQPRFRLLDASLRYLLNDDPPRYEATHRFLQALIGLDDRQFPALTRLGDCDTEWLRAELALQDGNQARIEWLTQASRDAYRRAREVSRRVLRDLDTAPAPYRSYDLDSQEELISHSWGVTEDTIGQVSKDPVAFKRAVMLFLEAGGGRGWTTLALPLIHLEKLELAARATVVFRDLAQSKKERGFVRTQEKLLGKRGAQVPEGDRSEVDLLVPTIVRELLVDWKEIGLYDSPEQHREALCRLARRSARLLGRHEEINRMVAGLEG